MTKSDHLHTHEPLSDKNYSESGTMNSGPVHVICTEAISDMCKHECNDLYESDDHRDDINTTDQLNESDEHSDDVDPTRPDAYRDIIDQRIEQTDIHIVGNSPEKNSQGKITESWDDDPRTYLQHVLDDEQQFFRYHLAGPDGRPLRRKPRPDDARLLFQ